MVCDDVSDHEEMFMVIKVPAKNCTSHIQNELVPLFDVTRTYFFIEKIVLNLAEMC